MIWHGEVDFQTSLCVVRVTILHMVPSCCFLGDCMCHGLVLSIHTNDDDWCDCSFGSATKKQASEASWSKLFCISIITAQLMTRCRRLMLAWKRWMDYRKPLQGNIRNHQWSQWRNPLWPYLMHLSEVSIVCKLKSRRIGGFGAFHSQDNETFWINCMQHGCGLRIGNLPRPYLKHLSKLSTSTTTFEPSVKTVNRIWIEKSQNKGRWAFRLLCSKRLSMAIGQVEVSQSRNWIRELSLSRTCLTPAHRCTRTTSSLQ